MPTLTAIRGTVDRLWGIVNGDQDARILELPPEESRLVRLLTESSDPRRSFDSGALAAFGRDSGITTKFGCAIHQRDDLVAAQLTSVG